MRADDREEDDQIDDWVERTLERADDIGAMTRLHLDEAPAQLAAVARIHPRHPHTCRCGAIETGEPHSGHYPDCPRHIANAA